MSAQPASLTISAVGRSGSGGDMIVSARMVCGQAPQASHRALMPAMRQTSLCASGLCGAYPINSSFVRFAQSCLANSPSRGITPPSRGARPTRELGVKARAHGDVTKCRGYGACRPIRAHMPQTRQADRITSRASVREAAYASEVIVDHGETTLADGPCINCSLTAVRRSLQPSTCSGLSTFVAKTAWMKTAIARTFECGSDDVRESALLIAANDHAHPCRSMNWRLRVRVASPLRGAA